LRSGAACWINGAMRTPIFGSDFGIASGLPLFAILVATLAMSKTVQLYELLGITIGA
jgi:hypothetical protein